MIEKELDAVASGVLIGENAGGSSDVDMGPLDAFVDELREVPGRSAASAVGASSVLQVGTFTLHHVHIVLVQRHPPQILLTPAIINCKKKHLSPVLINFSANWSLLQNKPAKL